MIKGNKIKNIVENILVLEPNTRSSDRLLIKRVYDKLGVDTTDMFVKVILDYDLPSTETITRARRLVQMNRPELKANEKVQKDREYLIEEYKEFAVCGDSKGVLA